MVSSPPLPDKAEGQEDPGPPEDHGAGPRHMRHRGPVEPGSPGQGQSVQEGGRHETHPHPRQHLPLAEPRQPLHQEEEGRGAGDHQDEEDDPTGPLMDSGGGQRPQEKVRRGLQPEIPTWANAAPACGRTPPVRWPRR